MLFEAGRAVFINNSKMYSRKISRVLTVRAVLKLIWSHLKTKNIWRMKRYYNGVSQNRSLRASSPVWASEASRTSERRSREGPRGLSLPRPCLRVSSRVPLVRPLFTIPAKQRACSQARKTPAKSLADDAVQLAILGI